MKKDALPGVTKEGLPLYKLVELPGLYMTYTSYYEYATAEDLEEAKEELLKQIGDLEKKLHDMTVKAAHLTKSVYNMNQVVNQYLGGGNITDSPYGVGWDGQTEVSPSANAVYDALASTNSSLSSLSSTVDGHTTTIGQHSTDITTLYNNVSNKANTASPTLTGTPLAPTATAGTNTTQIATTAFVTTAVTNGVAGVNQYSDEKVDDRVNALVSVSAPLTKTYDDTGNSLSLGVNTFGTAQAGVVPASGGGTSNYLRADGTWSTPPDTNTTYSNFTSSTAGLAPASGGGTTNFLRADGTWTAPPGGGGGAPTDSQYITLATDATLTNERVLTAGTGISLADGGAGGNATVTIGDDVWRTVFIKNTSTSLTLTGTTETTVWTGTAALPANVMKANGLVEILSLVRITTNATAGTRILRVKLGGTTIAQTANHTTVNVTRSWQKYIFGGNRNNTSSQIWTVDAGTNNTFGLESDTALFTTTFNTTTNLDLSITAQGISGDVVEVGLVYIRVSPRA